MSALRGPEEFDYNAHAAVCPSTYFIIHSSTR